MTNSDRLIRLINDILDIERMESGRVRLELENTDACELVRRSIESVRGGAEAAREGHPDAILLDVMMPDMDGPPTLAHLQADPATRDIPVVFLTARAQSADRTRLAQLGAAGILTKPFDPLTLAQDLATTLHW